MQARAAAVEELAASGALEDISGSGESDLDRELAKLSSSTQVDDELAKLKAEVGSGKEAKALEEGEQS